MTVTLAQANDVVDSLELPYPIYADPAWDLYKTYDTGFVAGPPMPAWVVIDGKRTIRYLWRARPGDGNRLSRGRRDPHRARKTSLGDHHVTPPARGHPEAYEDFQVGDHVYCLAWIGMPFVIVGKDDNTGKIELDGLGPCSLPDGAKVDIDTPYMYMLSHNLGDQIWYRPDRAGETYDQVLARFVNGQGEDALVDGYVVTGWRVLPTPEMAATYRVSFDALNAWNQIFAQPVTAAAEDGKTRIVAYDESIPDDAWQPSGPATPLRLGMISYRWALSSGFVVLNWRDFLLDD